MVRDCSLALPWPCEAAVPQASQFEFVLWRLVYAPAMLPWLCGPRKADCHTDSWAVAVAAMHASSAAVQSMVPMRRVILVVSQLPCLPAQESCTAPQGMHVLVTCVTTQLGKGKWSSTAMKLRKWIAKLWFLWHCACLVRLTSLHQPGV